MPRLSTPSVRPEPVERRELVLFGASGRVAAGSPPASAAGPTCTRHPTLIALFFSLLLSNVANAQQKKGLVLGIETFGHLHDKEGWRKIYKGTIESKLRQLGIETLASPVNEVLCREQSCFETVSRSQHADIVVAARVAADRQNPPGYMINLWAYRIGAATPFMEREISCAGCTEDEVNERLKTLDGDLFIDKNLNVSSAPQANATALVPVAVQKSQAKAIIGTGAAIGIAGLALLGTGIAFLVLDGTCRSAAISPMTECREIYTSATAGGILTGVGAALTIGGAIGLGIGVHRLHQAQKLNVSLHPLFSQSFVGLSLTVQQ